jgi:hypothetical protein
LRRAGLRVAGAAWTHLLDSDRESAERGFLDEARAERLWQVLHVLEVVLRHATAVQNNF